MKAFAVLILAFVGHGQELKNTSKTLRQWIKDTKCLNVASQPLMNTQFAELGALDALRDAGVWDKVTGLSGVSSGAFVMALAATEDFAQNSRKFRQIWPGWANLVPEGKGGMKDPHFSEYYTKRILNKVLPNSFEELKIPLSVTAVAYKDETAATNIDGKRADPMVLSDGDLPGAVLVSSSAMSGPGCPKCLTGFSAKHFRNHWPVADGFLLDEYGTVGLHALDECKNLLHVQPQNFAQQLTPTKNKDLDTEPNNVVSLGIDVPSSAIMSMMWDMLSNPINQMRKMTLQGDITLRKVANQDEVWEKLLYETAYDHMTEALDQPMQINPQDKDQHYYVDLELKEHWEHIRGWGERKWDKTFDAQHGQYWVKTTERRDKMVGERNEKIASKQLSFKACGNGLGAPRCNKAGKRLPEFFKGKRVPVYYSK